MSDAVRKRFGETAALVMGLMQQMRDEQKGLAQTIGQLAHALNTPKQLIRDPQTGEQIVAGLSQVHVEVIVERLHSRFGADVTLKPPRVPAKGEVRHVDPANVLCGRAVGLSRHGSEPSASTP